MDKKPAMQPGDDLHRARRTRKAAGGAPVLLIAVLLLLAAAVLGYFATQDAGEEQAAATKDSYVLADKLQEDVLYVAVQSADGENMTYVQQNGAVIVSEYPDYPLSASRLSDVTYASAHIEAQARVAEDSGNLAMYGLDSPQYTVLINYADGEQLSLRIGDKAAATNAWYAQAGDDPAVYTIAGVVVEKWRYTIRDLYAAQMPAWPEQYLRAAFRKADAYDIELSYFSPDSVPDLVLTNMRMIKPYKYFVDEDKFLELTEAMQNLSLSGFLERLPEGELKYGLDAPRYEVIVQSDTGIVYHLRIGDEVEEAYYACALDDSGDVFLISKTSLAALDALTPENLLDKYVGVLDYVKVSHIALSSPSATVSIALERMETEPATETRDAQYAYTFRAEDGAEIEESAFRSAYTELIALTWDGFVEKEVDLDAAPELVFTYAFHAREPLEIAFYAYDGDHFAVYRDGQALFTVLKERVYAVIAAFEALT